MTDVSGLTLHQKLNRPTDFRDLSNLCIGLLCAGVAALGGRMYVIGGNDGSAFLSSCEVFDPMTNKWSYVAPMDKPRAGLGADVLDGILYVAGRVLVLLAPCIITDSRLL